MDDKSHENLTAAKRIVQRHIYEQPFNKELMLYINADLNGANCPKSDKKYGQCEVINIPPGTDPCLKAFVEDGVWSLPCAWCSNWIFYRLKEFPLNATMKVHWEKAGWHRTHAKHFLCPCCQPAESSSRPAKVF